MKILGICGSPRKGNSERMLCEVLKACNDSGSETKSVLLRNIKFSDCCGKNECFHEGNCDVLDEMTQVLLDLDKADALILAAPSYFNNVPALMKRFMDRSNPYCKAQKFAGKRVVLLSTGGATLRSVKKCEAAMRDFCELHGMKVVDSVCTVVEKEDEVQKDKQKLEECYKVGKKLVEN